MSRRMSGRPRVGEREMRRRRAARRWDFVCAVGVSWVAKRVVRRVEVWVMRMRDGGVGLGTGDGDRGWKWKGGEEGIWEGEG